MMLQLRTTGLDWREIDQDIVILDGRDASYRSCCAWGSVIAGAAGRCSNTDASSGLSVPLMVGWPYDA